MNIEGCSAIVTGGISGLGAATARLLVERGAKVVAVDINEDKGRAFAAEFGPELVFYKADVVSETEVQAAIGVAASMGPLRIAVNCAGIGCPPARTVGKGATPYPLEVFRRTVEVNLVGAFNCTRLAATEMSKQEPYDDYGSRGAIVNVGSLAARDGQTGQAPYSAAKAGIAGMTLPLSRDLSIIGVRVNTILPGIFETPIYEVPGVDKDDIDQFKAKLVADNQHPVRLGEPREFASMALELVQNEFMNGDTIRIDAAARLRPNLNR